jgi:hypothetical protein
MVGSPYFRRNRSEEIIGRAGADAHWTNIALPVRGEFCYEPRFFPTVFPRSFLMDEMREIYGDAGHGLRGPHHEGFAPLRLRTEPGRVPIVVARPEAVVGRHTEVDVRLAFPEVSRRHCRLAFEQGQWRVHDLNSLNGVFVNDDRMADAPLFEGDRLRVGPIVLVVEAATARRACGPEELVIRQIVAQLPSEAA